MQSRDTAFLLWLFRTRPNLPSRGNLIRVFGKLVDNDQLVKDLNVFTGERNFLSHRAITSRIDPGGDLDHAEIQALNNKLVWIETEAKRLAAAIGEAAGPIFAHLHFDLIPVSGDPPAE